MSRDLATMELLVAGRLQAVADAPMARLARRAEWYRTWGFGPGEGFGASELAFLRWEVARGVLAPVGAGGSRWWRAVNTALLHDSELAVEVRQAGLTGAVGAASAAGAAGPRDLPESVRMWLHYLDAPSGRSWYRAHNASVLRAYAVHADLARLEPPAEAMFLNEVLYRLLYAQALESGFALGALGRLVAGPAGPAVDAIVHVSALYPQQYPATDADLRDVLSKWFDEEILEHARKLYAWAAAVNAAPWLLGLLRDGKPAYP